MALDFVMPQIHDNPTGWGPLAHFPLPSALPGVRELALGGKGSHSEGGPEQDRTSIQESGRSGIPKLSVASRKLEAGNLKGTTLSTY